MPLAQLTGTLPIKILYLYACEVTEVCKRCLLAPSGDSDMHFIINVVRLYYSSSQESIRLEVLLILYLGSIN
jgi:hypothetical protein